MKQRHLENIEDNLIRKLLTSIVVVLAYLIIIPLGVLYEAGGDAIDYYCCAHRNLKCAILSAWHGKQKT